MSRIIMWAVNKVVGIVVGSHPLNIKAHFEIRKRKKRIRSISICSFQWTVSNSKILIFYVLLNFSSKNVSSLLAVFDSFLTCEHSAKTQNCLQRSHLMARMQSAVKP